MSHYLERTVLPSENGEFPINFELDLGGNQNTVISLNTRSSMTNEYGNRDKIADIMKSMLLEEDVQADIASRLRTFYAIGSEDEVSLLPNSFVIDNGHITSVGTRGIEKGTRITPDRIVIYEVQDGIVNGNERAEDPLIESMIAGRTGAVNLPAYENDGIETEDYQYDDYIWFTIDNEGNQTLVLINISLNTNPAIDQFTVSKYATWPLESLGHLRYLRDGERRTRPGIEGDEESIRYTNEVIIPFYDDVFYPRTK